MPQRSNRPAQSSETRKLEKKGSSSKAKSSDSKKSETKESSSSSSSEHQEDGKEPEKISTDLASEYEAFQDKELENLKRLVQEQKISTEQRRAFLAGAVENAQASRLQNTYTIYSYKNEQISIIFSQEGELLYVTPDPDYLYFK